MTSSPASQLAVHCRFLQRFGDLSRAEPVALCQHPVREGQACVGPFLEDLGTSCGLWEPHPQRDLLPLAQPERWRRRLRREGFDYQRPYYGDWH